MSFKQSISPGEIKMIQSLCQEIQAFTAKEAVFFNKAGKLLPGYGRQLYFWDQLPIGDDLTPEREIEIAGLAVRVSQISRNALYQLSQSMIYMNSLGHANIGIGIIPPPDPCDECPPL